ncbi:MAG: diadenylate cyclase CdaA [Acidobacteria bacterium]|nr:diadenylate cyclase CdaA [Acidobacteriota bacterium]MQC25446.1 TIGR00159 family protein [Chloroflexota bacterium]MQC48561.1 TIGR00159 family protein [Chloroflexota bacterium]
MPAIPEAVSDVVLRFNLAAAVDILIVSGSIYWLLLLVRGTTAMTVLRGVGVLLVAAFILSRILDLRVLNWILRNSVAGLLIGMIIVFQPEIRRALERLGRTGLHSFLRREERQDALNIVVRAAFVLSRQNVGALIVLERETGLKEVIDTGVPINATISSELLLSIFPETSPLHDGAVVLRLDRLVAAGCTLPLSESPLPAEYGMRHRAAVGITERTDAVVVVVSEERGQVSLCSNGRMVPNLDEQYLSRQLHRLFDVDYVDPADSPQSGERRAS